MQEEQQLQQEKTAIVPTLNDQLQQAIWDDKPMAQPAATVAEEQKVEAVVIEEKKEDAQPTTVEWWKGFEFDSEDAAKNEITELRKLKGRQPEEIKFVNEQSKLLFDYLKEGKEDEAFEIISQKKAIEKVTAGEVTESNAADILKLSIKNKYKELSKEFSDADVERKFNKQYGISKEPVYDEVKETEEDFKERHLAWQEKVAETKADMILDAKVAKPELESLKSQLVLPDISKKENQETKREPTQEELDAFGKQKESFLQKATAVINGFSGFAAQIKDKDVDYSVSYNPSADEKTAVGQKLELFAEKGFDANAIFYDRWVNKDGTLNESTMTEDLLRIFTGKNSDQKIATESANQRLELYIKGKKNINLNNGGSGGDFVVEAKTQSEEIQEKFWNN